MWRKILNSMWTGQDAVDLENKWDTESPLKSLLWLYRMSTSWVAKLNHSIGASTGISQSPKNKKKYRSG